MADKEKFFTEEFYVIYAGGMTELENHHFVTPNENRHISRYKQLSSMDIKISWKQSGNLVTKGTSRQHLILLIKLAFTARRTIHHSMLHAVMQKDVLGTTCEVFLPKKILQNLIKTLD